MAQGQNPGESQPPPRRTALGPSPNPALDDGTHAGPEPGRFVVIELTEAAELIELRSRDSAMGGTDGPLSSSPSGLLRRLSYGHRPWPEAPAQELKRRRPIVAEAVDRRVLVNHAQPRALCLPPGSWQAAVGATTAACQLPGGRQSALG